MSDSGIDLRSYVSAEDARERGRAARRRVPVTDRDRAVESPDRPGVLDFLAASNRGRIERLIPLRVGRMAASPFTFFRGAAGLMAADLAAGPASGLTAQICGDAHAANFGLYGNQRGQIVMDINDFDETVLGPWEWDLDRLAASLVLAGREGGADEDECLRAARDAARSYRRTVADLAELPFLEAWTAMHDESILTDAKAEDLTDNFKKAAKKARKNTSAKVVAKWTEHLDDHETDISKHRFVSDPPVLTAVDERVAEAVIDGLERYAGTLRESRRALLARFAVSDVAFRIVGTGSVGLHSYVALLHGNDGEALVLQVKQAAPSSLTPFLPPVPPRHEGERIVVGARSVQSDTDILLGWTTVELDEPLPFIVRQFRNLKGSIDPAGLSADDLDDYGRLAGALLARAHARSLDPRTLAGYLEDDEDAFEEAVARYAVRYADRTEADHAELVAAVAAGTVTAEPS
ncbi:DUF2252 domain-containing protein [Nocardia asteroides NBRC 15531]|uniref:DUF2252 domain-containing protein n=1 Tax=Nocardia asteroides NBRC 15531 TaxID=1110697 RepID=U5E8P3_NOCAS|nr:DUF2252 domain-containing protein [Nocardia asteroides]TLF67024.1 DUF2252 domain-containing protein [Nocardia asteroides NBRC 15531]UGT51709.1 DUF2252 domain-containing protein [Nocardia asteroides]SFM19026.1 Uncharacterized conserved protein, DUF2252 family [Nocardia asteroides]VEG35385.1 Uncharacterized protein conserved in bacteria [Nocardia asteroides]GAD86457.1 hypothetical protein NCAST_32_09430 [Nocardia asteroides NBRC 15531]